MNNWKHFIEYCQRPDMIKLRAFNPGPSMVKVSRGAKAGAISGAIYGALLSPIMNIALWAQFIWFRPIEFLPTRVTLGEMLVNLMTEGWFWVSTMMGAIFGVIIGMFFGSLFNDIYDKLPGKTPMIRGVVTSIIQWLALFLFVASPWGWATITLSLGLSILWGLLLGRFWASERLSKL